MRPRYQKTKSRKRYTEEYFIHPAGTSLWAHKFLWVIGESMSQRFKKISLEHRLIDDPEKNFPYYLPPWRCI